MGRKNTRNGQKQSARAWRTRVKDSGFVMSRTDVVVPDPDADPVPVPE